MIKTYSQTSKTKIDRKYTRNLAQKVWNSYKKNKCVASINFVDSKTMIGIHGQYLGDFTDTDVITFDLGVGPDGKEIADIFICVDMAELNAKKFNCPFEHEVARLVIHGMLHFVGYTDATPKERHQMHLLENEFLTKFPANS